MIDLPQPARARPYKRTPLLIAAYATLSAALINLILGAGMFWIAGSAGLAVVLGATEIVVQVRRRSAAAQDVSNGL